MMYLKSTYDIGSALFIQQVANVSAKAANFKGKGFLLVHGTADGQFTSFVKAIISMNVRK